MSVEHAAQQTCLRRQKRVDAASACLPSPSAIQANRQVPCRFRRCKGLLPRFPAQPVAAQSFRDAGRGYPRRRKRRTDISVARRAVRSARFLQPEYSPRAATPGGSLDDTSRQSSRGHWPQRWKAWPHAFFPSPLLPMSHRRNAVSRARVGNTAHRHHRHASLAAAHITVPLARRREQPSNIELRPLASPVQRRWRHRSALVLAQTGEQRSGA